MWYVALSIMQVLHEMPRTMGELLADESRQSSSGSFVTLPFAFQVRSARRRLGSDLF
jgi:hypothetical protein